MARSITVIPARQSLTADAENSQSVRKLRMAAYCRVSTDQEEQLLSYENQLNYYTGYISNNPLYQFAGIYAEMKIPKVIQFETMNPTRKGRNKGFWHIDCCQKPLFFCFETGEENMWVHF